MILSVAEVFFFLGFLFIKMPIKIRIAGELRDSEETVDEKSFVDNLKYTLKLCVSKQMLWLYLPMFWSGASIAYFNGMLIPIMVL